MLKGAISVIPGILRDFERKHLSLIAAGLAYNFVMSLLPALILLTSLAAYLPLHNGVYGLIAFLSPLIPEHTMELIIQVLRMIASHRAGLLSFASLTTLWLTSVATKSIIAGLDIVYEVPEPRRVWTNKILAVGLSLAVGILLLTAVLLTLVGPFVERLLSKAAPPVQSIWMQIWPSAHWALAAMFTFAAIEFLYLFAANIPASPRQTVVGALAATFGLLILAWGLGWFSRFGESKLGGLLEAVATPIAVAVWLHWSATIVLLGAEINLNIFRKSRVKEKPGT